MSDTPREVLEAHARQRPHAAFLVSPETGRTLTYGALAREARRVARALAARGLRRGDKVAFYLHNSLQTVVLFLGAMAGGYVVVPLNLLAQRSQLAWVIGHCDCRLIYSARAYERTLAEALAEVHRTVEVVYLDPDAAQFPDEGAADDEWPEPVASRDAALLMYTSGTTGKPKGVLLDHANLLAAARHVAAWHGLGPQDRCLSALPLYHVNGQVIATLAPFVSGGSIVAPHRFSVSAWWHWVEHHAPSWLNVVPTILAYLVNAGLPAQVPRFRSVRFARSASAPLPPDLQRAFERSFGIPVIEAMGMTETASVVFCNPSDPARRKYGSVGLPCGVEAKVVDPASGRVLGDGMTGEICVRGPNVMSGYYKSPEETAAAFDREGWLRTGDLGYRDADGFYFVTGRLKELIVKGGENIAPREIDEALLRHPAVLEAAAVGVPDPDYGQEICAYVVLKPGAAADAEALRAHCQAELGRYKTPREFRFVAELPKGPSGKVQRLALAAAR